jgi:hypothetical protein
MSCSRHSSVIVFGPRSDASTISVFCCAVNLRYFLVSLNADSFSLSGRCSTLSRTVRQRRSAARLPLKSERAECQRSHGVHAATRYALPVKPS